MIPEQREHLVQTPRAADQMRLRSRPLFGPDHSLHIRRQFRFGQVMIAHTG